MSLDVAVIAHKIKPLPPFRGKFSKISGKLVCAALRLRKHSLGTVEMPTENPG